MDLCLTALAADAATIAPPDILFQAFADCLDDMETAEHQQCLLMATLQHAVKLSGGHRRIVAIADQNMMPPFNPTHLS